MTADMATVTKGIPTEVVEYLHRHHVITLSTSSFTGMPHADTVVYMNDAHCIYFFAGEGTQMLRNIKDSRRISFTIDDYTIDWRKVRELQGVGRCQPVPANDEANAWTLHLSKFGPQTSRPPGILYAITPSEMHFVDYDYAVVAGQTAAQLRSRVYQIEDAPAPPAQGAVSTNLDRLTYEEGQIVFRPGDSTGEYYVVIDGEVEIRGEGYGADQTVLRLGPGQFFGDQATLRGQKGALTCHAVKRSILLAVDRTALRDLLEAGPL
jgi:nitroimidazol reductase NimA-like FMN-containing flavoprotein (pyridoxamine 5'-phosphate oxidase superfamily)